MSSITYIENDSHADIQVERQGQNPLFMLGAGGIIREERSIQGLDFTKSLPVFLGIGFGNALKSLYKNYNGPVAIIDKEKDIQALTKVKEQLQKELSPEQVENILWLDMPHEAEVLRHLTLWQKKHHGLPFCPIIHPFYLRYHKEWYMYLREQVQASQTVDFWAKVRKPRFTHAKPRILLITSKYFLMGELAHACQSLGIEYTLLTLPDESIASSEFIKKLLTAVVEFQPDCLLTLNHLGIDREGVLMDLLEQLQLPLASWFVDNPHLIVHSYQKLKSPWVTLFTWDSDNIASLQELGFPHVFYLPLGTNPELFSPNTKGNPAWKCDISFVGNSMLYKVQTRLQKMPLPPSILENFKETAARFSLCSDRSVMEFLAQNAPHEHALYEALPSNEERLGYETALTWEATRIYRASCVEKILPFSPILVGDDGWNVLFAQEKKRFTYHRELNYYSELHTFYPLSAINFNCTSKQMKGAVNQRIFDAPACHGFVLTDWREQMDNLLEPHKEIAFYKEQEEIPDLVRYYLAHPKERETITKAARRRILAEHTWAHRLQNLLQQMRHVYGIQAVK